MDLGCVIIHYIFFIIIWIIVIYIIIIIICEHSQLVIPLVYDTILNSLGPIKPSLAICTLAVFVLVYFALWKGVKSTGKVNLMKIKKRRARLKIVLKISSV